MNYIVSSIIEVSVNKIALWISVGVDDWTAERVLIASNGSLFLACCWDTGNGMNVALGLHFPFLSFYRKESKE